MDLLAIEACGATCVINLHQMRLKRCKGLENLSKNNVVILVQLTNGKKKKYLIVLCKWIRVSL